MLYHHKQNPLFTAFDDIIEIFQAATTAVFRWGEFAAVPGSSTHASDAAQFAELKTLGQLHPPPPGSHTSGDDGKVRATWPMDQIEFQSQKKQMEELQRSSLLNVLVRWSPTIAPGYDHITSPPRRGAGGLARHAMLCYVTPQGTPWACPYAGRRGAKGLIRLQDAAHAADLARHRPGRPRPRRTNSAAPATLSN